MTICNGTVRIYGTVDQDIYLWCTKCKVKKLYDYNKTLRQNLDLFPPHENIILAGVKT